MTRARQNYQTQWSAQFYAAAELTRRGYLVSFPLGNAIFADLQASTPKMKHFHVDVKGMKSKNFWLVKKNTPREDHFYILVYLPEIPDPPQCYILSSKDMMREIEKQKQHILSMGRKWVDGKFEGMNWGASQKYRDKWQSLPS